MSLRTDTTKTEFSPGTLVGGRLRVERLIARGGMGAVYLAHQIGPDRKVALKTLKPMLSAEDRKEFGERFEREMRALASLEHPNIVTLYDSGQTPEGEWFIAMQYIDGQRMNDLLKEGRLAPPRAVDLAVQVCQALQYAHARGIVHRDIKLSNVLVYRDDLGIERVKVVDFGLVKLADSPNDLTRAGMVLGSPHFMSPEQIQELQVDHRSDIYSVGVLLYAALTAKYPFHGENKLSVINAHLTKSPPPMRDLCPELQIPDDLEQVVRRALQRDREKRWQDMSAFIAALQGARGDLTPGVASATSPDDTLRIEPVTGLTEARPPTGADRWLPWLTVAIALLSLLGVAAVAIVLAVLTANGSLRPTAPTPSASPAPAAEVRPEPASEPDAAIIPRPVEAQDTGILLRSAEPSVKRPRSAPAPAPATDLLRPDAPATPVGASTEDTVAPPTPEESAPEPEPEAPAPVPERKGSLDLKAWE